MKKLMFLCLFLSACSSSYSNYDSTLEPWLGQPQQSLEQAWGEPYNVQNITPETELWTYMKTSSAPLSGEDNPYPQEVAYSQIDMPDFGFPSQPQYDVNYCKTLFTITNNVVVNYSFNGDNCVVNSGW